jgi:predicted metal-dependent phosphoesterase TrpH
MGPHRARQPPAAYNDSVKSLTSDLNADLHCHSVVSDGTLTPEVLAGRAKANGVDLWALTDHDEIGGQRRARTAAHALGLPYLTGVEISVTFANVTVHIVGLGFDPDHPQLVQGLSATRGGREARAREMAAGLATAGILGAYEGALKYVGNPELISRTHFARHLVEAGGTAVIAHPGRYKFTPNEEYALFTEFIAHGGRGVEVITGSHGAADFVKYADMAIEFGLLASRGSDFHSPAESHIDLGKLPPLPNRLTPVWGALAHRISHPS